MFIYCSDRSIMYSNANCQWSINYNDVDNILCNNNNNFVLFSLSASAWSLMPLVRVLSNSWHYKMVMTLLQAYVRTQWLALFWLS